MGPHCQGYVRSVLSRIAVLGAAVLGSLSANAADVPADEPAKAPLEQIFMTGSRLKLTESQETQEVRIYDRDRIERGGQATVAAFAGYFDLNTIPLSLVERIEVLPTGSSAVYEGEALMGSRLTVWTAPDAGTEIELTILVAHAYPDAAPRRSWLDRLSSNSAESGS